MTATSKRTHQVGTPANAVDEDDFSDETPVKNISVLEAFKQSLKEDDAKGAEPYRLTVPERPAITLVFDTSFDYDTYQAWINKATDKKKQDVNYWRLAVMVLSAQNTAIEFEGEEVPDFTLTSHELHDFLGVPRGSVAAGIRELYKKKDGHAIQSMRMVVEKAGYTMDGDVQEAEDGPLAV